VYWNLSGQPPSGRSFEAEAGGNTLSRQAAVRSSAAASGGALVGFVGNGTANYLQFNNVQSGTGAAGAYPVTVYYASGENRSTTISVNGGAATTVSTPGTGGWNTVGSVSVTLTLNAGANTIRLGNPAAGRRTSTASWWGSSHPSAVGIQTRIGPRSRLAHA